MASSGRVAPTRWRTPEFNPEQEVDAVLAGPSLEGPFYVVEFTLPLSIELISDSGTTERHLTPTRSRAYPVREIQSILQH